ncbi:DNA polymerase zeta catalytic subunit-like protein [Tanacetum coccineum]
MLFYLTSLHVSYALTDSEPRDPYLVDGQNDPTKAQMMNDAKPVVKQVEELQIIIHEIEVEGMVKDYCHKKEHGGGNSRGNSNEANHVESPKEFAGVIESFLTTNVVDWWSDTGATKHICKSRRIFLYYQKVTEPERMFMGNETATKIEGKGKVILKFTSGKDLVLSNVLHAPNITKNLIYGPILINKGFKLVFESDKFVITKGGVYVGKGYLDGGLFKLSVVTDDNVINNNNAGTSAASVYMIDPSFLWHSRLGHVNFRSLQRMINLGMLPKWAPHSLWGEACHAANTILNKIPLKKSDKSPYQLWKGKQPSYKKIKVWGCLENVQIPLPKRTKLGPKTIVCICLGPAKNSAAYRFLVYKSNVEDVSNNTILEFVESDFFENIFPFKDKEKQISNPRKRVMSDQLSQDQIDNNSEVPQENVEPRRSFIGSSIIIPLPLSCDCCEEIVVAAQVSTSATTVTITTEEITLSQALEALKTLKPKVKGIIFQELVMPITTAEDKAQRRLEVKARTTKKTQRNLLKQQYENFTAPRSEMLVQTFDRLQKLSLRSLSPEWNTHAVVWRNKADLYTMSMDNLYNKLKVYEPEVKGMSISSSSTQNIAFVSSSNNNTSSTNRAVNTAHGVSTASTQVNAANFTIIDNLGDVVICSFFASQPNSPQLVHEDLQQIYPDDMEEMDLRWQMAMLTLRARRALRNQDNENKESLKRSVPVEISTTTALVSCDGLGGYDWSDQAKEGPNYALMAFSSSNSDSEVSNDSICLKSCLKTIKSLKSQNDQLLKDLKYYEVMVLVPPPYTGNFMPPTPNLSFTGLDEFVNEPIVENCKAVSSEEEPKVVRKNDDALF